MTVQFTARKFLGTITLQGRQWCVEFPEDELPDWIRFYERMTKRYGHKTPSYASALAALKGLT